MKKIFVLPFVFLLAVSLSAYEFNLDLSPEAFKKCKIIWDEGVSFAQVTRIEKLDNRSNFVRENLMIGGYYSLQTLGLPLFDFELDIRAYYPFRQNFNGMKQKTHNLICYAFDGFFGAQQTFKQFKYVYLNGAFGMHYMYQLTDEYHMHYLGVQGELGVELPVSQRWTIVNRNCFSYDNANLGKNKNVQIFDASYHYNIDLGVRYTKRVPNEFPYIKSKKKTPRTDVVEGPSEEQSL